MKSSGIRSFFSTTAMRASGAALMLAAGSAVHAEGDGEGGTKLSAWGWTTMGQVIKSRYVYVQPSRLVPNDPSLPDDAFWSDVFQGYNFNRSWLMLLDAGVKLTNDVTDRTRLTVHGGFRYAFNAVVRKENPAENVKHFRKTERPYLIEASIRSRLIENEALSFGLTGGYFSVKYNPHAYNLGEYLFRSNMYPQVLVSGFETSDKWKVLALRLQLDLFEIFNQQLYVTSETEVYPLYDFGLAYLATVNPLKFLEIGAGVYAHRLVSVDPEKTTPGLLTDTYSAEADQRYVMHIDGNDTTFYTFKGTKAMGRIAVDPLFLLKPGLLNEEEGKLYAEVGVIGIKDYPIYYDSLHQRVPVMVGFNFPTFKFLDVLSLQVEYFANRYSNSAKTVWESRSPVPFLGELRSGKLEDDNLYPYKHEDDWKWSIYGKRRITDFLEVSGQVASDHTQRNDYMTGYFQVYEQLCLRPQDYYWILRLKFYL